MEKNGFEDYGFFLITSGHDNIIQYQYVNFAMKLKMLTQQIYCELKC